MLRSKIKLQLSCGNELAWAFHPSSQNSCLVLNGILLVNKISMHKLSSTLFQRDLLAWRWGDILIDVDVLRVNVAPLPPYPNMTMFLLYSGTIRRPPLGWFDVWSNPLNRSWWKSLFPSLALFSTHIVKLRFHLFQFAHIPYSSTTSIIVTSAFSLLICTTFSSPFIRYGLSLLAVSYQN